MFENLNEYPRANVVNNTFRLNYDKLAIIEWVFYFISFTFVMHMIGNNLTSIGIIFFFYQIN